MKTIAVALLAFLPLLAAATACAGSAGGGRGKVPGVGDPAPPFDLPGSDGKRYRLADFAGKQVVVLAWFPKAFTSG